MNNFKKAFLLFTLIILSNIVLSQKIENLDFELKGREVYLNFNLTPKYDSREIYEASVYITEKQSGYDQVSTNINFRKKLNLSRELVIGIRPGNNIIKINLDYLNLL